MKRGKPELTSVDGSTGVLKLKLVITKGNLLKVNFPVGLAAHRDVMKLASIRSLIDSTKDGLASVFLAGSDAEGEYRGIEELLVDHVVERWGNVVDRDPVICKAKNAIEPAGRVNEKFEK